MSCSTIFKPVIFAALSAVLALFSVTSQARILRVIHTNDLHAHFDHATFPSRGGYAAVKAKIDQIKSDAQARGEEVLVLDAGDFTEGSQYYLQGKGAGPFQLMNQMGYDAVVIGNHDWLMGPSHLDWLLPVANPNFAFLGANFSERPEREFISQYIQPYSIFERAGVRVAVLGLTTNEFLYSWRVKEGDGSGIDDPIRVASRLLPKIQREADVVIALTHIGVKKDIDLVQKNRGIDLVVGGHSHSCLYEPAWAEDKDKRMVPIVQTGNHGEYIGVTSMDIEPGRDPVLLDYKLVPIYADGPKDAAVLAQQEDVRHKLLDEYGRDFLEETVAESEVPLDNPSEGPTAWSRVLAESLRYSAGTDLSFDMPQFHGNSQPAGPVSMERLFELYPRMFDFEDRYGWNVWTGKVSGWLIASAIRIFAMADQPTVIGGAKIDVTYDEKGQMKVKKITVNGKPIHPLKQYTVAFGEGIVRASTEISPAFRLIVKKPRNTGKPVWLEVKRYIQEVLGGRITKNSATIDSRGRKFDLAHFRGKVREEAALQKAARSPGSKSDPEATCAIGPSGELFYRRMIDGVLKH